MITFNYETPFNLNKEGVVTKWIEAAIEKESFSPGEINFIFCDDPYLHKINIEYLNHDTFTDIISFDYCEGKTLHGDIFISVDRVQENAKEYGVEFFNELSRVMIHGVLHFCGYQDKNKREKSIMRQKEDAYLLILEELYLK